MFSESKEMQNANLPASSVWNMEGDGVGAHPTSDHENGSQRPRLEIQAHVEQGKHSSHDEAVVEHHELMKRYRRLQQRLRVRQQKHDGEEDGPHEAQMNGHVHRVVVERAIERKLLLQVQHPSSVNPHPLTISMFSHNLNVSVTVDKL